MYELYEFVKQQHYTISCEIKKNEELLKVTHEMLRN